jgi:hypothetical protein
MAAAVSALAPHLTQLRPVKGPPFFSLFADNPVWTTSRRSFSQELLLPGSWPASLLGESGLPGGVGVDTHNGGGGASASPSHPRALASSMPVGFEGLPHLVMDPA